MSDKQTKDFVVYLEDDDSKKEVYVDIVEVNPAYISFKTYSDNIITIPMTRVLKIKRKDTNDPE